jgi:lysophospholipase L1-like esterase
MLTLVVACAGNGGSPGDPDGSGIAGGGAQIGTSGAGSAGVPSGGMHSTSGDGGAGASAGNAGASAGGGASPQGEAGSAGSATGAGTGGAGTGGAGSGGAGTGGAAAASGAGAAAGNAGNTGTGSGSPCPPRGTPCRIMPLGDSITFGYGSTTGGGYRVELFSQALAAGKSITFVGSSTSGPDTVSGAAFPKENEGHSGYSIDDSSQTKGISPLVDSAIATYKPNIILLMIGTNDMHYSIDLANAPTRLGQLLDQITTDAPKALLVVAKIIPAHGAQNTPTIAYNAAIPDVVQKRVAQGKQIVLVDMYDALKVWSTALYKDSEHPNDTGYAMMAQTWYPAIQNALP